MVQELQDRLMKKVSKQSLPARILLNKFCIPDNTKREYQDIAFWYYLGLEEQPKQIADVGSKFGLEVACCALGVKEKPFVVLYEMQSRLSKTNIKLVNANLDYYTDWNLIIVNGDFSDYVDSIWHKMKLGSLLCLTNACEKFKDFAKVKNRVPAFCELRQTIGLLRK